MSSSYVITPADVQSKRHTPEALLIQTTLKIANLDRKDVDFFLNNAQLEVDSRVAQMYNDHRPVRLYQPKSRRRGVSAYWAARFFIKCVTQRNIKAGIVAHKGEEATKLFEKVKYYMKHMKTNQPTRKYDTKRGISFPDTDSTFSVYTAGSEEVARGLDENHVHLSEVAFYNDPASLMKSLGQTVPLSGELIGESTGNGSHTWYHRQCLRALEGEKWDYGLLFLDAQSNIDNRLPLTEEEKSELLKDLPGHLYEEKQLLEKYPDLSLEFIAWRRMKIREADLDIWSFKQEFPMSLDECFIPGARSYFHYVMFLENDKRWTTLDNDSAILQGHPNKNLHYALGADVAAGVENDSSVAEVICLETNEQVFEYRSNKIPPDDFAIIIEDIGEKFLWPLAMVEANNHGHVTLDNLVKRGVYPSEMIYWDQAHATNITEAGHTTNRRTKPLMVGHLRRALVNNLRIYSSILMGECSTFTDKLEADTGCHDDTVIALGLAWKGIEEVHNYLLDSNLYKAIRQPDLNPFSFDAAFRHRTNQQFSICGQPIKSQVAPNISDLIN